MGGRAQGRSVGLGGGARAPAGSEPEARERGGRGAHRNGNGADKAAHARALALVHAAAGVQHGLLGHACTHTHKKGSGCAG